MKTRTAILPSLLVVAMLGIFVWAVFRPRPDDRASTASPLQSSPQEKAPPTAIPTATPAASVESPADSAAATGDRAGADAALKALRTRLSDPRHRAADLQKARAQVEQMKGRLFQRLSKISPEKLDRLKTILAETELASRLAGLPTQTDVTTAEAQQINEALNRVRAESDRQVSALLGAEDYAKYAAYQNSAAYRDTLEQVTNIMRARGRPVTDDQQEAMLDAYADAMRSAARESANDVTPAAFAAMSEAQRQALRLQQLGRFDQYLATNTAGILNPADYKLFMEAQYAQENGSAP